jgi:predicted nucleotide-binding protein
MERSLDDIRDFLRQRGVRFTEARIQYGTALRCPAGEIITHYDRRDKVVVGGKATPLADEVKAWLASDEFTPDTEVPDPIRVASADAKPAGRSKDIFIVYGHDTSAREGLELLIHRMKLNPIVLGRLTPDGDTIIEKLERYLGQHSNVGFACVLLTPDDEGYPVGRADEKKYRARQNVILELGMVLGRLGRARVAILRKETVEHPSDIAGLIYLPFRERVEEVCSTLFRTLQENGYQPDPAALGGP